MFFNFFNFYFFNESEVCMQYTVLELELPNMPQNRGCWHVIIDSMYTLNLYTSVKKLLYMLPYHPLLGEPWRFSWGKLRLTNKLPNRGLPWISVKLKAIICRKFIKHFDPIVGAKYNVFWTFAYILYTMGVFSKVLWSKLMESSLIHLWK